MIKNEGFDKMMFNAELILIDGMQNLFDKI
jgi:hypothetical protein